MRARMQDCFYKESSEEFSERQNVVFRKNFERAKDIFKKDLKLIKNTNGKCKISELKSRHAIRLLKKQRQNIERLQRKTTSFSPQDIQSIQDIFKPIPDTMDYLFDGEDVVNSTFDQGFYC